MPKRFLIGVLLGALLLGCSGGEPLRQKQTPDYMVKGYNPEFKIGMDYYLQRSYTLKKRGERFTAVEYVRYQDELNLSADTTDLHLTIRLSNPKEVYVTVWKHLEVEVYKPITLVERNTNYQLIYEGRLPTRSYQLALPVEDNQRYKLFIELKKGGGERNTILKTFEINYRKQP